MQQGPSFSSSGNPIDLPAFLDSLKGAFDAELAEMNIDGGTRKLSVSHQILKGLRSIREMVQNLILSTQEERVLDSEVVSRIHALRVPIAVYEVLAGIGDALSSDGLKHIASSQSHAVLKRQNELLPLAECKMNGGRFMQKQVFDRVVRHSVQQDPTHRDLLVILEKKVDEAFGPEYAGLSELIYFLLDGDLRTAEEIIISQTRRRRKYPDESPDKPENFGKHFMGFLGMYGDVSEYVLERSVHSTLTAQHVMSVLKKILQDPCLRQFIEITDASPHNMYSVLQRSLSNSDIEQNPWMHADLSHTPFAVSQLGTTMERSVPRQALAPVLVELNDHERFLFIREAQSVITEFDRLRNDTNALPNLRHRIVSALQKLRVPFAENDEENVPQEKVLADMVSSLERAVEEYENPMEAAETDEGKALPEHVMLRLIDVGRMVGSQKLQQEVQDLIKTIRKFDAQIRSPLLVRSIQILLHSENPAMDVPILSAGRNRSLREQLLQLAKNKYEDAIFTDGPHHLAHRFAHPALPLFRARDAEMLASTPAQLSKNFNTAAIGPERGMLIEAGKKFVEIHGYKNSARFIERAIRAHLGIEKQSGAYNVTLHPGATEAFRAFVLQCVPQWQTGDFAVITSQEYGHMTDVLRLAMAHDERKNTHVKAMHLNDRTTGKSKNAAQLLEEFQSHFDPRHTKIIILSEVTRFGDRPCAMSDVQKSHEELSTFIASVRTIAPGVPIVIDGCQAIGRTLALPLNACAPDAYIGSGSKALGVGPSAFMVTSRSLPMGQPFEHDPSTLPLPNLVAMGIGLDQLHRNHDFMRFDGNLGSNKGQSQEALVRNQMAYLTSHAIRTAGDHARKVMERLNQGEIQAWEHANTTEMSLSDILQCRVVYPVHRDAYNYTGILVINFPNMSAQQMASLLQKDSGIETLPCLEKSLGLRLSFHYLHDTAHIDTLFEAIADAHVKKLRERIQRPTLELKAEFDMPAG